MTDQEWAPARVPPQTWTIGELSRRTGVATSALRYYEDLGLIRSERNAAGHRRYHRATARRVAFIVFAQRVGLSLEMVSAELARLPSDTIPTDEDWARLTRNWRECIDQRLAELQLLRTGLTECIGCGCLSLERCRFMNPDDEAANRGPGPRYWLGDPRPQQDCRPEGIAAKGTGKPAPESSQVRRDR
jgi:MerR family redox-sensitive transcriptional activator SoxR